ESELRDVAAVDRAERRESLLVVGASVGQPVSGLGVGAADSRAVDAGGARTNGICARSWCCGRGSDDLTRLSLLVAGDGAHGERNAEERCPSASTVHDPSDGRAATLSRQLDLTGPIQRAG